MENLHQGLTLENLPRAVAQLTDDVSKIKSLLLKQANNQPSETDRWFDLNQFCIYHPDKPSKSTVYGWVKSGFIPVHKGGKKLRFLKSEIDAWLAQGRKKTHAELQEESIQFLKPKKR